MKKKLELRGKMWFGIYGLNDFESAKQTISEVFYPDQEEYYRQLEDWAKNEVTDIGCSSWISSFLWKGRTMPVNQIQVLRYKGNIEKGKSYLLRKYEEKLGWDNKKKQERESRRNSLFNSYDENYNSFQEICSNFENKYSLFPICICSNVETKDIPNLSIFGDWTDGIKIQHDSIHYSIILEDLTLSSTNRYFYTYHSKYKKNSQKYIIYSDEAFCLIKEYLMVVLPEISFNDNIAGCITMLDYTSKSYTIAITSLLSYSKDDYSPSPKVEIQFEKEKNIGAPCGYQNTLGYRVFSNAAIFHVAKEIEYPIDIPLNQTLNNEELGSLISAIECKINELSFEDRYLCHFIDCKRYKFPTDQLDFYDIFRSSRRINLFHNVQHHYSTPIFQEWKFTFGKIVNQYQNNDFQKNTESVGADFYKYKTDKRMWLDKDNKLFLFNLRILFYLNWVFVCNETGNIKKLSSLWMYRILYKCQLDTYQKDKAFFSSLLYYALIQNERIFLIVIDRIQKENKDLGGISEYNSYSVFYNLVRYYSNSFNGWGKKLSYEQLNFLNAGKKNHDLLNLFNQKQTNKVIIDDTIVFEFAKQMFEYIENLLVNDKHPHSETLSIFTDMKPFEIPNNFIYERKRHNNYVEYNGDYSGTYAHDVMGYSNNDIDTIFDGDPNAYWNID